MKLFRLWPSDFVPKPVQTITPALWQKNAFEICNIQKRQILTDQLFIRNILCQHIFRLHTVKIHHIDTVEVSSLISHGCKLLAAPPKTHLSNQTLRGLLSADSSLGLPQQVVCFIHVCVFGTSSEESDWAPEDSDKWTGGAQDPISNLVISFWEDLWT